MRKLLYIILFFMAVLCGAEPAQAHKLKVFATVENNTVSGYGFFIGGGRPRGAEVVIRDADARESYRGKTDDEGRFSWKASGPGEFTVIVDTMEGHVARTTLTAERFSGAGEGNAAAKNPDTERMIEDAVARQVRPLLERIEEMDARLLLADIVSGICMILGLGGIGLWALGHKGKPGA